MGERSLKALCSELFFSWVMQVIRGEERYAELTAHAWARECDRLGFHRFDMLPGGIRRRNMWTVGVWAGGMCVLVFAAGWCRIRVF